MTLVKIKRVYEPLEDSDGFRILVDRLWPRGVKKETADIDAWLKEVAPSTGLRKWFNHEPEKWEAFQKEYEAELKQNESVKELIELIKQHNKATLLYGAKDEQHNHALVLERFIKPLIK